MKRFFWIFIVFCSLSLFWACSNSGKQSNQAEADAVDAVDVEEVKELINAIPAPNSLIIMNMLNETGAGYIYDIVNEAEYVNNYLTTQQKALGLGIYCADLSYVSIYHMKDEANEYIKVFYRLIDELQIQGINQTYISRVEQNLDIKDSLISIVNEVIANSNQYLNSSEQIDVALNVLVGSWIETVYLIQKTVEFSTNREVLIKIILKNQQMLNKILELLEKKKNSEAFAEIYNQLNHINNLFEKVSTNFDNTEKIRELEIAIKEARDNII